MPDLRALKHRHDARGTRHVKAVVAFMREMADADPWPDDDHDDGFDPVCGTCFGDGTDPWCDHLLPCPECQGEQPHA